MFIATLTQVYEASASSIFNKKKILNLISAKIMRQVWEVNVQTKLNFLNF